ncbi:hypothetical protein [Carboxydothermus ferrireducens]|uniref:Uncharacterized protein n=1 Tax=Carboxydothermus ferrireducens DSM 11255 TaxID=1119529 RepID=A0ABX2R7G3_9THEO|nr:hypothetical protein [Carboxydothermus ferrireducens]NYE57104.1 hypothetical protein [Carboxydothermus ferrireducens DSM 11255]
MNKSSILVMSLVIVIALITAGVVRASYVDTDKISPDNLEKYKIISLGGINEGNLSFSDLVNDSEVIVKGIALDERKYLHGASLASFKVVSVYKGDRSLKDKTIYIFEPSFFNFKYKTFYIYNGYNFMKNGDKYILFLKKWPYNRYVRYNPFYRNKDLYLLSHNSGIDKYNVNNVLFNKFVSEEQKYYGQIKQYEFIAYSKEEVDKYNEIKRKVLSNFLN